MAAVPVEAEQGDPEFGLLARVRASKRSEMAEQVRQLHLVIEWCAAHQVEETESATYVEFGKDTGLALAGDGAPHVSEFAVTETVEVTGTMDLADAVDLETAISQGAAEQKALGSTESLDVRRSRAAGMLARRQNTLDLNPDSADNRTRDVRPVSDVHRDMERARGTALVKPRQAVIHVHTHDPDTARCETTRSPISVEQVKSWCADPDTQVVIKPVVDLNEHVHVDRYEVPARLDQQVSERDINCVFPFCARPAASCDTDHCVPYDAGGPTCTCNLAVACRGHHRAKTHGGWDYLTLRPGHYLWRSPSGYWFYRDGTGTRDLGHLTPD